MNKGGNGDRGRKELSRRSAGRRVFRKGPEPTDDGQACAGVEGSSPTSSVWDEGREGCGQRNDAPGLDSCIEGTGLDMRGEEVVGFGIEGGGRRESLLMEGGPVCGWLSMRGYQGVVKEAM